MSDMLPGMHVTMTFDDTNVKVILVPKLDPEGHGLMELRVTPLNADSLWGMCRLSIADDSGKVLDEQVMICSKRGEFTWVKEWE